MSRNGSGVYSLPAGSAAVDNAIIDPVVFNTLISDLESDANTARPIVAGGTGATTAAAARTNLGAMVQPTYSAGLGQIAVVYAPQSTVFSVPAGGTWWGRYTRRNNSTLGVIAQNAGIYGGGTNILTLGTGEDCLGDFIRIA